MRQALRDGRSKSADPRPGGEGIFIIYVILWGACVFPNSAQLRSGFVRQPRAKTLMGRENWSPR